MANFIINISEQQTDSYITRNTEIVKENCNGINTLFDVQILNDETLPENTIKLLNSYDLDNSWSQMNISNISYSNESKLHLTNNTIILQEDESYQYDVSSTNINENVINFKVKSNFDNNDFNTENITFDISFETSEGTYETKSIQISLSPNLCSQESNPRVTEITTGETECDSQYIAISIENTPYSNINFQYKTLNEGNNGYTATLHKLESFNGDVVNSSNLIISDDYRNIIKQIDEGGINFYRMEICANESAEELSNKCSIIININDINGTNLLYSYILTDEN